MNAQEYLKGYLLKVLERVEARKKEKGIVPSHTTGWEFREELKGDLEQAARTLAEEGKIKMGETLNDEYMMRT